MISVVMPLSKSEAEERINRCLDSLAQQTYQDFEVVVVTSAHISQKFSNLFRRYPFVKVIVGEWNKSAARNIGARKSEGQYLLNADADMEFPPNLLQELAQKKRESAVIIPFEVADKVNFWGKCRKLERDIIRGSSLVTPVFVEKSLFQKIGGFDERFDPLDDWGLNLKLKKAGVKFTYSQSRIVLHISPTLKESFQRMFQRGRALPTLQQEYPDLYQTKIKDKIKIYRDKWPLLLASPVYTLGLLFLKTVDLLAFWWGKKHPKFSYTLRKTAVSYDRRRLTSNRGRYKHFAECRALFSLLDSGQGRILEVGCGTGRITLELVKRGFEVVPADPSKAMLEQFREKKNLPEPIRADGTDLPFKRNHFETAVAIRVIWHLSPEKQRVVLSEMIHVSSKTVILDVANKNRFLAKLLTGPSTYPVVLEDFLMDCQKNGLEVRKIIPLDIGIPLWLNLIPSRLAEEIFPLLYRLDLVLAKAISPGRYLLKLEITCSPSSSTEP